MEELKLFMLLIGCAPPQRHTEQHDVFFSVGNSLKDLVPDIINFWPEAEGNIHIDAWREVTSLDGHTISISPKEKTIRVSDTKKLFFINLGGYKQNEFEEFHYKMLTIGNTKKTKQPKKQKIPLFIGTQVSIMRHHILTIDME